MLLACTMKSTRAIRSTPGLTVTARKVLKDVSTLCPGTGTGRTKRSSMPHRIRERTEDSRKSLPIRAQLRP
jgi:hypothetical protein